MADFSQFFSGQPWGSWGSGAGQAPQPPMPQGPQVPPEVIAALRAKLGLDEPAEAQGAAEAAAARVRAPYAKANERQSGLPDIFNYYSNKLASAVTAPRDALTGAMQVTDPETGMPTKEAMERGQGVANLAMTGGIPFARAGAAGMAGGRLAQPAPAVPLASGERIGFKSLGTAREPSLTPAITHNGKVYAADAGGTHLDALSKVPQDQRAAASLNGDNRVYVTQNGRVLDRWRGQDFAVKNDLLDPSAPDYAKRSPELIGEWLRKPEKPAGTLSDFITAYHGSPHDFDRFDLSKIGTGEGAQAYGHGLYFAENEGVAKEYRKALAQATGNLYVGGKPIYQGQKKVGSIGSDLADRLLNIHDWDIDKAIGRAKEALASPNLTRARPQYQEALTHLENAKELGVSPEKNEGRMYQVAIKAPPEHFLDWDKPLKDQPELLDKFRQVVSPDIRDVFEANVKHGIAGANAYHNYIGTGRGGEAATKALREAGIPGIKYLDQGSRAAPAQVGHLQRQISGLEDILRQSPEREDVQKALAGRRSELAQAQKTTNNYVVFDDKLIDILKKYGLAGLAALPAMNAFHYQDKGN